MEDISHDSHRTLPVLRLRKLPWCRSGFGHRIQPGLVGCIQHLLWRTHTRGLQRSPRLRKILRCSGRVGSHRQQYSWNLFRCSGLPNARSVSKVSTKIHLDLRRRCYVLCLCSRWARPPFRYLPKLPRSYGLLGDHLLHHRP